MFKKFFIFFVFTSFLIAQSRVPDWAKDAVWYQIFPERFANGDPSNDPKAIDIVQAWPFYVPEGWNITPWTDDWYKRQPWEEKGDFYRNTALRRYGGDLQGVLNKLDYLQELGITAIYFNPLFESPSHHKYDGAMYHHIDNNFGPNPEKDRAIWQRENPADPTTWKWTTADSLFLKLIKVAHKRGMKVVIDGVFNHVGTSFWAFQDVKKNGAKSPYKDWFDIISFDDPSTPENEFDYKGWIGIKSLPEFREENGSLVTPVKKHIFAIVERWMDPNGDGNPEDGIDGWRLDVAEMVGHNFWKEFRQKVKSINPDAYITGEIWWDDYSKNKMFNAAPWLQGDEFDAVMNYRFAKAVKRFIADKKMAISSKEFKEWIEQIFKEYPKENIYVLQNLLDSHDVERFVSSIVNPDHWIDHGGRPDWNNHWKIRKPTPHEYSRYKLAIGLQMTMPGAPMIYYGDEAGMWGGDDPDCRKPMVWPEYTYEPESHHPFGKPRPVDSVFFNWDLFHWFKKMISIRNENSVLRRGNIDFIETMNPDLLAFFRTSDTDTMMIIVNRNKNKLKIRLEHPAVQAWLQKGKKVDLISHMEIPSHDDLWIRGESIMIIK